ncbi:MAG: flagellar assembly protein FliH [Pseudohongiellaceae bacterium]|nr:flagellar assembly protein FliH [Pseudohongiellaceae bacterium]
MERHLFEGVGRVSADVAAKAKVNTWLPPTIDASGHLVPAQPREKEAEAQAPEPQLTPEEMLGTAYTDAQAKGYQEGLAEGKKDGFAQGQQEGLNKGMEEGLKKGQLQIDAKLADLSGLMTSLTHALNEQDYKLEQALLGLSQSIAKTIIAHELAIDNRHIVALVRQALAAMPPSKDNIRIFVNPADVAILEEAKQKQGDQWKALPDDTVKQGGCRIETEQSIVDFTMEKRFQDLMDQILSKELATPLEGESEEEFEAAPEPLVKKVLQEPEPEAEEEPEEVEPSITEEVEALREAQRQSGPEGDGQP